MKKRSLILAVSLLCTACEPHADADNSSAWSALRLATQKILGFPTKKPLETKDRMPPAEMKLLVRKPIEMADRGDLDAARAAIDLMIAGAPGDVRAADLTEAFGVELILAGAHRDPDASGYQCRMIDLALDYLQRAIGSYERAFGAIHPETAVALHSYAGGMSVLVPDPLPQAGMDALKRAYRIRVATLGAKNPETIAAFKDLELWGHPKGVKPPFNTECEINDAGHSVRKTADGG